MSSVRERVLFSEDSSRLAVCSLDGEVKIWNSATRTLVSRFTPEGARGTIVAAARWSRCIPKQRKSGQKIAVAVGSKVIVWNEAKGRQECVLSGVHTGVISDVEWGRDNVCIYLASEDKYVTEWNTGTWECAHKWQADRHGVKCICCHGDRDIIATAGCSIKLWSCKDHSLLKRFSGHSTSICSIVFISDNLLLSCAHDDRIINLWSAEVKGSGSVASFTCEEEVLSIHVTVSMGTIHVVALTQEGVAHMFKYPLTNQITAPISAHSTLQFTTPPNKGDTPSPLPILAVCISPDGITLAHSSPITPHIETMRWDDCTEGRICLVRDEVRGLLLATQDNQKKKKSNTARHSVTVLGAEHHITLTATTLLPSTVTEDIPLSSRLSVEGVASREGTRVASVESLSQLLSQAIQSGDKSLLEEALRIRRDVVIRQTLHRLPLQLIIPFMKQLVKMLEVSPGRGLELSLWIKHLLTQHSSYLMSQPQLVPTLSSFYQILEVRSSVYSKLCKIHGKLDLMNIHETDTHSNDVISEALVTATVGEQVIEDSSLNQVSSDDQLSDLESDQSEADSDVSMDTAEHKQHELT